MNSRRTNSGACRDEPQPTDGTPVMRRDRCRWRRALAECINQNRYRKAISLSMTPKIDTAATPASSRPVRRCGSLSTISINPCSASLAEAAPSTRLQTDPHHHNSVQRRPSACSRNYHKQPAQCCANTTAHSDCFVLSSKGGSQFYSPRHHQRCVSVAVSLKLEPRYQLAVQLRKPIVVSKSVTCRSHLSAQAEVSQRPAADGRPSAGY